LAFIAQPLIATSSNSDNTFFIFYPFVKKPLITEWLF